MYLLLSSCHETLVFASQELKYYLNQAGLADIDIFPMAQATHPGIYLGTASELAARFNLSIQASPWDDAFEIDIQAGTGFIAASNPRSVLFGVYAFLRSLGFDWPNPQTQVYHPKSKLKPDRLCFRCRQAGAFRHRGIVLEGANASSNVLDMIAWLPKLYYNSYFIQFQTPYTFFANWYKHVGNPYLTPGDFPLEEAIRIKKTMETELKRRDLLYHGVGHAWTSESIGIKGLGWEPQEVSLTETQRACLAQVKGQRQLFEGISLNTNLCYSNPQALDLFASQVISYMKENPATDFLHIWLADGFNNFCECPHCLDKLPADQYIDLLNHLDRALHQEHIPVKLVFLIYYDLMWPPQNKKLVNPDRFVLMFAPISRTYETSYADVKAIPPIFSYHKNQIRLPHSVAENLSYLKAWQDQFSGDSFVFDYPLGRAHYGDPGYMKIAKTIFRDIRSLKKLKLQGYLSCQEQRCFFPHALPNYVMGLALWDESLSFDQICQDFFYHTYGPKAGELWPLLEKISYAFNTDYWNHVISHHQPWYADQLGVVASYANQLEAITGHALRSLDPSLEDQADSLCLAYYQNWKILSYLPEYLRLMSQALAAKASGQGQAALSAFQALEHYVRKNEYNLQPVLDVFRLLNLGHNYVHLDWPQKDQWPPTWPRA